MYWVVGRLSGLVGIAALGTLVGCGPLVGDGAGTESDSSSSSGSTDTQSSPPNPTSVSTSGIPTSSGDTTTGVVPSTGEPPDPGTTTGEPETTNAAMGVDGVIPSDVGMILCSTWDQDCRRGQKCAPWSTSGSGTWNSTRCSPIDPDPDGPGESCVAEQSAISGVDSCDGTSMCFNVDEELNGICTPFCIGSPEEPGCADPNRACTFGGDGVLALCLLTCDALEQDCPAGQGCYPGPNGFLCTTDASGEGGGDDEPCGFLNDCDPGLMCIPALETADCTSDDGCCTPYCDSGLGNTCPGDGEICAGFYKEGKAPPGQENLGVCLLP